MPRDVDIPASILRTPTYGQARNFARDYNRLLESELPTQEELAAAAAAASVAAGNPPLQTPQQPAVTTPLPITAAGIVPIPRSQSFPSLRGGTVMVYVIASMPDDDRRTDNRLLQTIYQAARELGFDLRIDSAFRHRVVAGSSNRSNHMIGKAVDIDLVNGKPASLDHPNRPTNRDAMELVRWLIAHGHVPGSDGGSSPGVIFGKKSGQGGELGWNRVDENHHHHVHVSV
jgi:hypothetical protein